MNDRALVYGFAYLRQIDAFVRLAEIANRPGMFLVDVRPKDELPDGELMIGNDVVWWEYSDKAADVVRRAVEHVIGGDTRVTRVRRPMRFIVNNDANFVQWLPAAR